MRGFLKPLVTVAAVAILIAFANIGAKADPITFNTTGSFNGDVFSSLSATVFGGMGNQLGLVFNGVTNSIVDSSPAGFTFANLGTIQTQVLGLGVTITPGTTFEIRLTQTVPSGGSGDFSGTVSGAISQDSSTGEITFTVTHIDINGVQYEFEDNTLALVPQSTNNGITTIQGRVTTSTPEPTSMLLLGTGLAGVAGAVRRKLRARNQNELKRNCSQVNP